MLRKKIKQSFLLFITTLFCNHLLCQPSTIPNLVLWLHADSGVVLNGSTVNQWNDISGNNNNAIQSVVASQPLYISGTPELNNKPVIRFDGTDDVLLINSGDTVGSAFVVIKWNGALPNFPAYNSVLTQQNYTSLPKGLFIAQQGTTDFYTAGTDVMFGINDFYVNGQQTINLSPIDEYKIISGVTSVQLQYLSDFVIGRFFQFPTFWNGDIAEIIVYRTQLTPSQRQQVEQYLSDKYAPPVNLGADTIISYGFCPLKINAHKDWFTSYQWSTGSTIDSISINNNGSFSVNVTNIFGYTSSDTIKVSYPFNQIANNNILCYSDTLKWDTQLDKAGYDFLWQDNSTDSVFTITQAGQYYVTVTDTIGAGCSFKSDTINVTVDSFPITTSLGPDTSLCSGASIGLVSGASQATSYVWSTGATTSSIIVTSSGTYSVTVQNGNGCIAKDTINVNVKGIKPTPDFIAPSVCFGDTTFFSDLSSVPLPDNISLWTWNFDDGNNSAIQNPFNTYTIAGTYTVTLTVVSDSGCSAVIQKPVTVNAKPTANFTIASSPVCSGVATQFLDASSVSNGSLSGWHWDFGDLSATNDTSNQATPVYTYTAAGTYSVQLIVTSNFGCKDTIASTVTVSLSPTAFFTADSVCEGNPTSFTDGSTGAQQWQWNFGDANNSTLQNPTHQYAAAGTYNVILFVTASNGCVNFYIDSVIVYHLPVPVFFGDSVCVNSGLQFIDASTVIGSTINAWNWSFSNGIPSSSASQNPIVAYTTTGTNIVSLTATSAQGCYLTMAQTVNVLPLPVADFSFSPTFGTPPLTVNFSDLSSGGTAYQWYFGDGGQSASQNPNYVYQDTGIFTILLISQSPFGCIDSLRDTIFVDYPLLDIAVLSVSTTKSSNTIQVSALLKNTGTLDVTTIELSAYFDNGTPVHEFLVDTAKPNKPPFAYQFNSSLELVNDRHSIVCVEVKKVNGKDDDVISNNKKCIAITNEFTLVDPFPNPTIDEIYFLFVAPDVSNVKAQIWDVRGRLVEKLFDGDAVKGLNQITYNTFKLNKGTYVLKLSYEEKNITKMFMKE